MMVMTASVCGSVMGVMGIVADICHEWSKDFVEGGIPGILFAGFFVSLVYFIFWNGRTEFFERALAVIVDHPDERRSNAFLMETLEMSCASVGPPSIMKRSSTSAMAVAATWKEPPVSSLMHRRYSHVRGC